MQKKTDQRRIIGQDIRRMAGFTLLELMITVAIIGLLCSIAIPSYTRFIKKAKWAGNITIVDSVAKHAMLCQQVTGFACSGAKGLVTASDIDLDSWPTSTTIADIGVVYSYDGSGFHIYMDTTDAIGTYHYRAPRKTSVLLA